AVTIPGAHLERQQQYHHGDRNRGESAQPGRHVRRADHGARQQGLATILAEPSLTAISGETANFLAGGEFPIPVPQGNQVTTIQYKNFGVSVDFTPTVLDGSRMSIKVRPEVSELTTVGAITINGTTVPAL